MAQALSVDNANKEILEKKHSNVGHQYFESKQYLDMIPKNEPKWILSELDINTNKYDATNLNYFIATHSNVGHPYMNDVVSALNTFQEWHNLKKLDSTAIDKESGWNLLKKVDNELNVYWTRIPNEAISATKSEMVVPYSVPIITGLLCNDDDHLCDYNPMIEKCQELENLNEYNLVKYCVYKRPIGLVSPRDFLLVRFIYVLTNCEVLIGERSIDSNPNDKNINNNSYVRAYCTLNAWHIRPYFKENKKNTHSFVTYYTHFRPNGYIPQWVVDQKVGEKAQIVLWAKKYIDSIKNKLYEPGLLHIPYPLLKMMKIFKNHKNDDKEEKDDNNNDDDDDENKQNEDNNNNIDQNEVSDI